MAGSDIAIEISGKITDIDTLVRLGDAAERDQASSDWLTALTSEDAEVAVIEAARAGNVICFVKADTSEPFELLSSFCRENGLSYRKQFSSPGDDGYHHARIWNPEFAGEVAFNLDDEGKPAIAMGALTEAVNAGPEAVAKLVNEANAVFAHVENQPMTISDDVIEAWEASRAVPVASSTPHF